MELGFVVHVCNDNSAGRIRIAGQTIATSTYCVISIYKTDTTSTRLLCINMTEHVHIQYNQVLMVEYKQETYRLYPEPDRGFQAKMWFTSDEPNTQT